MNNHEFKPYPDESWNEPPNRNFKNGKMPIDGKAILILLIGFALIAVLFMSSCTTQKYGCKQQNWYQSKSYASSKNFKS